MNSTPAPDRRAVSNSRKGLLIAIAASLVLFALAAYRVPLFNAELDGVIVGVSEVHNETGSKLIAAVQLETGAQILVPIPRDFLKQESVNVRVNEGRSLFGSKSYSIVAYRE